MSLVSGTRLGTYEILTPIGAGSMGEVYRARDTKLNRDVAITVVPRSQERRPNGGTLRAPTSVRIEATRISNPSASV